MTTDGNGGRGKGKGDRGRQAAQRRRKKAGRSPATKDALPGTSTASGKPMRLNRYIARAGLCSRREADEWISAGRVEVNGSTVTELGSRVQEGDQVAVNGRLISPRKAEYFLLNKPKDTITTTDDEKGRQTVLDLFDLPDAQKGALFPVGRLDRDTTGVLIVTSDGDLAHRLMHPSYEIEKLYRVRTRDPVSEQQLESLTRGLELEDGPAAADRVAYVVPGDPREVGVSLHEGRNRQVRRMFEALNHRVVELERVQYAGLSTQGVRRGKWRRLSEREVARLYRLVKLKD